MRAMCSAVLAEANTGRAFNLARLPGLPSVPQRVRGHTGKEPGTWAVLGVWWGLVARPRPPCPRTWPSPQSHPPPRAVARVSAHCG